MSMGSRLKNARLARVWAAALAAGEAPPVLSNHKGSFYTGKSGAVYSYQMTVAVPFGRAVLVAPTGPSHTTRAHLYRVRCALARAGVRYFEVPCLLPENSSAFHGVNLRVLRAAYDEELARQLRAVRYFDTHRLRHMAQQITDYGVLCGVDPGFLIPSLADDCDAVTRRAARFGATVVVVERS